MVITTVSISHYWKNFLRLKASGLSRVRSSYLLGWLYLGVFAALLLASISAAQAAPAVELQDMKLQRQESEVYLSGNWAFELPAALDEALLKGVTLYFVTEVDITQERWYFYNKRIAHAERHVRLYYQPLMRRWRAQISPQPFSGSGLGMSLGQSYDSAEEAMTAVRRLVQWRIANAADISPESKQTITINFRLDLKQLPRPLQIGAVGQGDWNIAFTKSQRLEVAAP